MQLFKVDKQFKISNDLEKARIEQLMVMSGQAFTAFKAAESKTTEAGKEEEREEQVKIC